MLYHLRETVRTTDAAWQAASNGGVAHLQAILTALATLEAAVTTTVAEGGEYPAAGSLLSLHDEGVAGLARARTTVRRLRAAAGGVERWVRETGLQVVVHEAATRFARALADDVVVKAAVLDEVEAAIDGAVAPSHTDTSRLIARWMEQTPRADALDADALIAVIDAHVTLLRARAADGACVVSPPRDVPAVSARQEQLSPALAMLKNSSAH